MATTDRSTPTTLLPLRDMPQATCRAIQVVMTDIDDTLTDDGQLLPPAYAALSDLKTAGIVVIPVTGRPAGWCDHIARMWPVDAVVGENGAFYFSYDHQQRRMKRRYWLNPLTRTEHRQRLTAIRDRILREVPGSAISADQAYREADLAIDYCEDVPPLGPDRVARIVQLFEQEGATAKISSIHVNGWFGEYDKLTMSAALLRERFERDIDDADTRARIAFVGDSPNDAPMFGFFPNAIGVANIRDFSAALTAAPRWITEKRGGDGFAEFAALLLANRA